MEYKSDYFLEFVLFQSVAFIFRYRQWNYLQSTTTKHSLQRLKTSMRTKLLSTEHLLEYNQYTDINYSLTFFSDIRLCKADHIHNFKTDMQLLQCTDEDEVRNQEQKD
jgi:hypothetical protein